jgi:integrase
VLDAILWEIAQGNVKATNALTLEDFGEQWLSRMSIRSAKTRRMLWRRHVLGTPLASMALVDIRRRHLRYFVETLSRKHKMIQAKGSARPVVESQQRLSPGTVNQVCSLVRTLFNVAVADEVLAVSPCSGTGFKIPGVASQGEDPWTWLSLEEIAQLLECPRLPMWARLRYATAIYTGLRQGELWGLRWRDLLLDGEKPRCVVRRSYCGPTKANKVHHLPLLPPAIEILKRVYREAHERSPDDLVFPTRRGGMAAEGYDAGWGDRFRAIAGIRREVRFHDFRHTCASHLLMGSWGRAWSLAEVRDYIGHSSIKTTERYAHIARGHLDQLAQATCGPSARIAHELSTHRMDLHALSSVSDEANDAISASKRKDAGLEEIRALPSMETHGAAPTWTMHGPSAEAQNAARELLLRTAAGEEVPDELVDRLAELVLKAPAARLALEVLRSGEHKLDRAIELAELVLRNVMRESVARSV